MSAELDRRALARELREVAEALHGERWFAMAPPWSGQFVLSGDEDPYAGRFVCCTDPTLHMDEEDLKGYENDDPGERAAFIARCDPATVQAVARALDAALSEREALEMDLDITKGALEDAREIFEGLQAGGLVPRSGVLKGDEALAMLRLEIALAAASEAREEGNGGG
jgi:hypothetical protein